jgi:LCP family protein required for cell wall assembly
MMPSGVSGETVRRANLPKTRNGRVIDPARRRQRRKTIALTVVCAIAVLVIAGGAALWAYARNIEAKINPVFADASFAKLLQQQTPPPGQPFYLMLIGSDVRPTGSTVQGARSDTLMVARIDPQKKTAMIVSIMRDSRVEIPGYGLNKINAAYSLGGTQLALETVRQLTGLPITKYVVVDFTGFQYIVNAMGGVWFNVPEKIDGIPAGTSRSPWQLKNRVLQKGYQLLNGAQALTFVRTRDQFANQDFTRVKDQQLFIKAMVKQGLQLSSVIRAPQIIDAVANDIETNMSLGDLAALAEQFKGMKDANFQTATAPGPAQYINGLSYVIIDQTAFSAMIDRMRNGGPLVPAAQQSGQASATVTPSAIAPADITLTIRNGAGVSGLVKKASAYFTKLGFKVVESGNANQFVYGKTLIVYKIATEAKAAPVSAALGYGEVIPAAGMYSFSGDILIVIGKDWRDPSATSQ